MARSALLRLLESWKVYSLCACESVNILNAHTADVACYIKDYRDSSRSENTSLSEEGHQSVIFARQVKQREEIRCTGVTRKAKSYFFVLLTKFNGIVRNVYKIQLFGRI